jgi:hypothetical protein
MAEEEVEGFRSTSTTSGKVEDEGLSKKDEHTSTGTGLTSETTNSIRIANEPSRTASIQSQNGEGNTVSAAALNFTPAASYSINSYNDGTVARIPESSSTRIENVIYSGRVQSIESQPAKPDQNERVQSIRSQPKQDTPAEFLPPLSSMPKTVDDVRNIREFARHSLANARDAPSVPGLVEDPEAVPSRTNSNKNPWENVTSVAVAVPDDGNNFDAVPTNEVYYVDPNTGKAMVTRSTLHHGRPAEVTLEVGPDGQILSVVGGTARLPGESNRQYLRQMSSFALWQLRQSPGKAGISWTGDQKHPYFCILVIIITGIMLCVELGVNGGKFHCNNEGLSTNVKEIENGSRYRCRRLCGQPYIWSSQRSSFALGS